MLVYIGAISTVSRPKVNFDISIESGGQFSVKSSQAGIDKKCSNGDLPCKQARFTMSTYLCIQCAQTFTLEHHFAGSLFGRYVNRDATKGIF